MPCCGMARGRADGPAGQRRWPAPNLIRQPPGSGTDHRSNRHAPAASRRKKPSPLALSPSSFGSNGEIRWTPCGHRSMRATGSRPTRRKRRPMVADHAVDPAFGRREERQGRQEQQHRHGLEQRRPAPSPPAARASGGGAGRDRRPAGPAAGAGASVNPAPVSSTVSSDRARPTRRARKSRSRSTHSATPNAQAARRGSRSPAARASSSARARRSSSAVPAVA